MFTAMMSRFYFLVGLIGLTLAVGAGWGVYELRRERAGEAPVAEVAPATESKAARAPADESSTPETAPAGVADAGGPTAPDARADAPAPASPSQEPRAVAAPPAAPAATPAPPPAPETTTAEAAPLPDEDAAAAASSPSAASSVDTGAQIEALSSAAEAEAPIPLPAPALSDQEPSVAAVVAAPAAEAEPAPSALEAAGEESAAPAEAVRAQTREAPAAPEQRTGAESVPQPAEQQAASAAPRALDEDEMAPTPSETTDRPDERRDVALAAPTAPGEGEAAPAADPHPPLAPPPAAEPARERPGSTVIGSGVPEESRPAPARAAETIRRALSALFGSAADAPIPELADRESAAAEPPTVPEAAAPDPVGAADRSGPAGIEPGAGPTFDIVRIAPGGQAVIAGRAPPDAEVEIRSGDRVVDRVRADRRGEWVAVPLEPLPAGDQELSLVARSKDLAAASDEVLVVAVPEPPPPQPAPRASGEPPPPQPPEVAVGQSPSTALAMALPRDGRGQGRILQAPGRLSSDGRLALMVLDYDESGRIRLRGEAPPGAPLRIYVDNAPAGAAVVEPSGQWSTVLEPTLAPGDYMLRLDQLDPSGKPTARLETPFTRASQPPVAGEVQVDFVIVQPGNSLWRIARRLFGEGMHYVHIYDVNHGQIRDPDLIYPGQVFEIPNGIGAAG